MLFPLVDSPAFILLFFFCFKSIISFYLRTQTFPSFSVPHQASWEKLEKNGERCSKFEVLCVRWKKSKSQQNTSIKNCLRHAVKLKNDSFLNKYFITSSWRHYKLLAFIKFILTRLVSLRLDFWGFFSQLLNQYIQMWYETKPRKMFSIYLMCNSLPCIVLLNPQIAFISLLLSC